MKPFRNYSLGVKFFSVIVTTTIVAAGLMIGGLFFRELSVFRQNTESELASLSRIIGESSVAAIDFGDKKKAQTIIASLEYRPRVLVGAIYNKEELHLTNVVVTENNAGEIIDTGVDGIAAITSIFGNGNVEENTRKLSRFFTQDS